VEAAVPLLVGVGLVAGVDDRAGPGGGAGDALPDVLGALGQAERGGLGGLQYFAGADSAGIVVGARVPVVLTSRADNVRMRIGSAAVAKLLVHAKRVAATGPVAV